MFALTDIDAVLCHIVDQCSRNGQSSPAEHDMRGLVEVELLHGEYV